MESRDTSGATAEGMTPTTPTLREMVIGWMDSLNDTLSISTMQMFGAVLDGTLRAG